MFVIILFYFKMIDKLINLLILMKLKPTSGWGRTTIIWKDNGIVMLYREEELKPEMVN